LCRPTQRLQAKENANSTNKKSKLSDCSTLVPKIINSIINSCEMKHKEGINGNENFIIKEVSGINGQGPDVARNALEINFVAAALTGGLKSVLQLSVALRNTCPTGY
jgi:hypothetical protein